MHSMPCRKWLWAHLDVSLSNWNDFSLWRWKVQIPTSRRGIPRYWKWYCYILSMSRWNIQTLWNVKLCIVPNWPLLSFKGQSSYYLSTWLILRLTRIIELQFMYPRLLQCLWSKFMPHLPSWLLLSNNYWCPQVMLSGYLLATRVSFVHDLRRRVSLWVQRVVTDTYLLSVSSWFLLLLWSEQQL